MGVCSEILTVRFVDDSMLVCVASCVQDYR